MKILLVKDSRKFHAQRVLAELPPQWTQFRSYKCVVLSYALFKALAICRSPTTLKRPDSSKQCQYLQLLNVHVHNM